MLHFLLPQENKFFRMIDELGTHANLSAHQLDEFVNAFSADDTEKAQTLGKQISTAKNQAKGQIQSLTREVCQTLITPFDREDIQELAMVMYNIPKHVEKIKDRMTANGLKDMDNDFRQFTRLIALAADGTEEVLQELSGKLHTKNIPLKAAVLDDLEDQGDHCLGEAIAKSAKTVENTREWILRKDLYEMLEEVTDLYRDAANIALRIVLKHS